MTLMPELHVSIRITADGELLYAAEQAHAPTPVEPDDPAETHEAGSLFGRVLRAGSSVVAPGLSVSSPV